MVCVKEMSSVRCAGFIKPRHLNALVQVELIILRSQRNSATPVYTGVALGV
jgi:hypothetical protein